MYLTSKGAFRPEVDTRRTGAASPLHLSNLRNLSAIKVKWKIMQNRKILFSGFFLFFCSQIVKLLKIYENLITFLNFWLHLHILTEKREISQKFAHFWKFIVLHLFFRGKILKPSPASWSSSQTLMRRLSRPSLRMV